MDIQNPKKTTIIDTKDFQSVYSKVNAIGERLSKNGASRSNILCYLTDILKPVNFAEIKKPEDVNNIYDELNRIENQLWVKGLAFDEVKTYIEGVITLTNREVKKKYWV